MRKDLAREIDNNVKALSRGDANQEQNKLSAAISAVAKKQKEGLDNVVGDYKLSGVDISYRPQTSGRKYSPVKTNNSQQDHNVAKTPAFQKYVGGTGRP